MYVLQLSLLFLRSMQNHVACLGLVGLYRYIPAVEESVIGIITEKYGENFAVDIGGPFTASLPVLAFEGATRRNRPNLQVWLPYHAYYMQRCCGTCPAAHHVHHSAYCCKMITCKPMKACTRPVSVLSGRFSTTI